MSASDDEPLLPLHARSDNDHDAYAPLGIPAATQPDLSPRHKRARSHTFDQALKARVLELARNFAESPRLLINLRDTGVDRERSPELVIEAVMQHCKSVPTTRLKSKKRGRTCSTFYRYENDGDSSLIGGDSAVLNRDYLEGAASLGRAAPAEIRHSLTRWAAALQIDWRLDRSLINSASVIESNLAPRHAPPMALETVKLIEEIAVNTEVVPFNVPLQPACY